MNPQPTAPERHYAGLDVSLDTTAVCVITDTGAVLWRGKCAATPETIAETLRRHAPALARAGLETGQLSNWLTLGLRRLGVPIACPGCAKTPTKHEIGLGPAAGGQLPV